ncbi:MAG: hypothetical protein J5J00_00990 [Deltaproteobacteria bacterium]|nr:hypothetical protein [Deltaproteobacteria bacterium]
MSINNLRSSFLLATLLLLAITGCQDRGGRDSAPSVPPAPEPAEEASPPAELPETSQQPESVATPTATPETAAEQEEGQPIGLPMVEGVEGEPPESPAPGEEQ